MLDQSPKTLDDALALVSRMEAYSAAAVESDSRSNNNSSSQDDARRKVHTVAQQPYRTVERLRKLENDLADQRRQVQQLMADNDFWRTRAEASVPAQPWQSTDTNWRVPPPSSAGSPSLMDVSMQQPMYQSWGQPPMPMSQPPSVSPQGYSTPWINRGRRRGRGNGRGRGRQFVDRNTCRTCVQTGHWSYGCPSVNQPPTTTTNQNQATINGVSDSNSSTHTYLSVVINGTKTSCLLDSGCEKNLLPTCLISDANLSPCDTV